MEIPNLRAQEMSHSNAGRVHNDEGIEAEKET